MLKQALICIIIALAISGCSKSAGSASPTTMPTAATTTGNQPETSLTQAAFPNLPAVTPTSSASPTPYTPFTVKPTVDNLKIRMNPGFLFEALMMVQQTDALTVLGTAPGNEWTYVQTATGTEGWVYSQLLQSSVDLTRIPVRAPKNLQVFKGRVVDASGKPIQGIEFSISVGGAAESADNTVVTDANGTFYSFMPETASGTWTVTYTTTACTSNVWNDTTCTTYKAGYTGSIDPPTQTVTLPQSGNPLLFTWK